ncbi:hypothetical protein [Nocardia concava]|uniref:hypothetical protein n=1 Tax=Nocardia concava TaxID=257281 RepID=UPI0009FF6D98|nr:hypothetical protein [Nocardia concava]
MVRDQIAADEWCEVDGLRVTTPVRTAFDIARRYPRDMAVPLLDSLCATTGLDPASVLDFAASHLGERGTARLRAIIELVDAGAASPQESRTRLFLIDNGFPTPETQIDVYDDQGRFVARLDMGWRDLQIALEYDGAQHWTSPKQFTRDVDRLAALESLNWLVIRVTATHLHTRPHLIRTRLHNAFVRRGVILPAP